jgi:hypothetical protein
VVTAGFLLGISALVEEYTAYIGDIDELKYLNFSRIRINGYLTR